MMIRFFQVIAAGAGEVADTYVAIYQVAELIPDDKLEMSDSLADKEAVSSPARVPSMAVRTTITSFITAW